jgi:hypothetical protein
MAELRERFRNWSRGRYVPPPPDDPTSTVFFISAGYYEPPWLVRAISRLLKFWLDHWQWIIAAIALPIGLAWLKL